MPSPFPGMDPFLESQNWGDCHLELISSMRAALMPQVLPRCVAEVEEHVYVEYEAREPGFYYTDAITNEACAFLRRTTTPFFLYVAYTAPHWPLHAHADDIAKYDGVFDEGWDVLRARRLRNLTDAGLLDECAQLSPRDERVGPWEHDAWQLARMRAYAAQIDRMDQGIGRIVETLRTVGALDDTLLLFVSDNGASDEELPKAQFETRTDVVPPGVRVGNTPAIEPGQADTYASYGVGWANLSNAPFRLYKRWVHEGGIATPLVVHWPNGELRSGGVEHAMFQLTDVLPTILDATGTEGPSGLAGRSMLSALRGGTVEARPLFWEHTGNAAIRLGDWKLVRGFGGSWELYALELDRTELRDVADDHPARVRELAALWGEWAEQAEVIPWQRILELYARRGQGEEEAWM